MSATNKYHNGVNTIVSPAARDNVLELSSVNWSDEEDLDLSKDFQEGVSVRPIEDFEQFKKQFNLKEILDKLVIKRQFFIPSKAMDINSFYIIEKEIGEGAYGKVYLAKHRKTGKNY